MGRSHPRVQATTNRKECLNSVKLSEHSTFAYTATIERVEAGEGGIESAGKPGREGYSGRGREGGSEVAHEILIAPVTVVRRRQLSVRRRRPIIVRHYTQREERERGLSLLPSSLPFPSSLSPYCVC